MMQTGYRIAMAARRVFRATAGQRNAGLSGGNQPLHIAQ